MLVLLAKWSILDVSRNNGCVSGDLLKIHIETIFQNTDSFLFLCKIKLKSPFYYFQISAKNANVTSDMHNAIKASSYSRKEDLFSVYHHHHVFPGVRHLPHCDQLPQQSLKMVWIVCFNCLHIKLFSEWMGLFVNESIYPWRSSANVSANA